MSDYKQLIEHSHIKTQECHDEPSSRLAFLADHIFQFTTYDDEMSEFFARKAIEVCAAINDRTTFDYISDAENYRWYITMCNMPFFADNVEWGTSVRGAFWRNIVELECWQLWEGDEQMGLTLFLGDQWTQFIGAIVEFAAE